VAPAGVPPDILKKVTADALQVMRMSEVREQIASHGATPVANTPEQFRTQIRDDHAKWLRVIQASGAKVD